MGAPLKYPNKTEPHTKPKKKCPHGHKLKVTGYYLVRQKDRHGRVYIIRRCKPCVIASVIQARERAQARLQGA